MLRRLRTKIMGEKNIILIISGPAGSGKNTVAEQGSDYGREIPESLFPSPMTAREGERESAAEYRSRHNRLSKFLDG